MQTGIDFLNQSAILQTMKNHSNEAGFTVIELLVCIMVFGGIGLTLFVAGHFIAKFW